MTALRRPVRRSIPGYVVILSPGADPMIEVRERGRRKGFGITVARLYTLLAMREADRLVAERRARRRSR